MDRAENDAPRGAQDLRSMARTFAQLGKLIMSPGPSPLEALVAVALERIPGTEAASVTTLAGDRFQTPAATDAWVLEVDQLQYQLGSGPCVDAILEDTVYRPTDLEHDPRWPEFGRRASEEFGVRSMLAFRLHLDVTDTIAALNLFSRQPGAFDEESEMVGLLVATHGAAAVNAALNGDRVVNLERALKTNRDIGTAVGILMASHQVTQQQAFDLLAVASQRSNQKLQLVAERVIQAGVLEISGGRGRIPVRREPRR